MNSLGTGKHNPHTFRRKGAIGHPNFLISLRGEAVSPLNFLAPLTDSIKTTCPSCYKSLFSISHLLLMREIVPDDKQCGLSNILPARKILCYRLNL